MPRTPRLIVTGTDTGIGKTVFAAALAAALGAAYWKPIQAGLEDGSDSEAAAVQDPVKIDFNSTDSKTPAKK